LGVDSERDKIAAVFGLPVTVAADYFQACFVFTESPVFAGKTNFNGTCPSGLLMNLPQNFQESD
jgi:hypothetical protein